jgi:hypothetical protein
MGEGGRKEEGGRGGEGRGEFVSYRAMGGMHTRIVVSYSESGER